MRINAWKIINNGTISCCGEDGEAGTLLLSNFSFRITPSCSLSPFSQMLMMHRNRAWQRRRGRKWRKHSLAGNRVREQRQDHSDRRSRRRQHFTQPSHYMVKRGRRRTWAHTSGHPQKLITHRICCSSAICRMIG